jgi:hypothetical protein
MASLKFERYFEYLPKDLTFRVGIAVAGISAAYVLGLVFYRLYLCPISKFPGPKIAAVTWWYELYYDVIHKGKYIYQIEKMHDKYGMYHRLADDTKPCRARHTAQYTTK